MGEKVRAVAPADWATQRESREERKKFQEFLKKNKLLLVSVDPGYDGYKIIVNDETAFHIRSLCLFDDRNGRDERVSRGTISICVQQDKGLVANYVMGSVAINEIIRLITINIDQAHNLHRENEELIKNAGEGPERFSTEAFAASFYGAVYAALFEYADKEGGNQIGFSVDDLKNLTDSGYTLRFMVELPDAYGADAKSQFVRSVLNSNFTANVRYNGEFFEVRSFDPSAFTYDTQAYSPYNGLIYEPFGLFKSDEDEELRLKKLPILMLIAGWRTLEQFEIGRDEMISCGDLNVPYEDYGMQRVVTAVAEEVNNEYGLDGKNRLLPESIQFLIDEDSDFYVKVDGRRVGVGLKKRVDKEIENQVSELIGYVDARYDIGRMKTIAVCGGTGSIYYNFIKKAFEENNDNISEVRLLSGYVGGEDYGPLYTVCAGGFIHLAVRVRVREYHDLGRG